jgi:predicted DNA-binding transcriptional regulator AlpA
MPTDDTHRRPDHEGDRHIFRRDWEETLGVCHMTIRRWERDPARNFPKPSFIGHRPTWWRSEMIAWIEAQRDRPRPEFHSNLPKRLHGAKKKRPSRRTGAGGGS